MKFSARNKIPGTVKEVHTSEVMAEVAITSDVQKNAYPYYRDSVEK